MKQRLLSYLALGLLPNIVQGKLVELELLNKSDLAIEYKDGIRNNPPTPILLKELGSGKTAKYIADTNQFPQLLIREMNKPAISYIFEFQPTEKTNLIRIRFVADKKGPRLEPQTQLFRPINGNITEDQIKFVRPVSESYTPRVEAPKTLTPSAPPLKQATQEKPLTTHQLPRIEQPIVPQAPSLTTVTPQGITIRLSDPAIPAPKPAGQTLSADLQREIQAGTVLKKSDRTIAAKPTTQESALAAGLAQRRTALENDQDDEEETTDRSAEIAHIAHKIKEVFSKDQRLTTEIAHKIATVYVDFPPVDFKSDTRAQRDITRRIAELAPSGRAQGAITLPNVQIPSPSAT